MMPASVGHGDGLCYHECRHCRHRTLWPQPQSAELTAYYNAQYVVPRDRQRDAAVRGASWVREALGAHRMTPGTMLEVGCSYGDLLAAFASRGWHTIGVETDARAAGVGRAEGRNIMTGAVPDALPDVRADVVVASHVLEHLPEPLHALVALAQRMAPHGVLLLRTPNIRSLAARIVGTHWEWSAVPEHVQLYSPESLRRVLAKAGFTAVSVTSARGDAHPLLVELALGAWRAMRGRGAGGGVSAGGVPPTHRPWFRRAAQFVGVMQSPLDWLFAPAMLSEELRVVAVRHPHTAEGGR